MARAKSEIISTNANKDTSIPVGEHHDGSFGVYMQHKRAKLQRQFAENFAAEKASGIFAEVSIWVDGYTDPPFEQLKAMVGAHGGHVDNYLSSAITHIVATNLPDSKVKQIREMRKWVPVVYPKWIVDSVRHGKLLNYSSYILPAFRESYPVISSFVNTSSAKPSVEDSSAPSRPAIPRPATTQQTIKRSFGKSESRDTHEDTSNPPPNSAGGDPLFMDGYFSSSRLHFIGSFRSHVQNIVAKGRNTTVSDDAGVASEPNVYVLDDDDSDDDAATAKPEHSSDYSAASPARGTVNAGVLAGIDGCWPATIVHIDVDCFFAQVALLSKPHLRDKPVAVAHAGARPGSVGVFRKQNFGDGVDTNITGLASGKIHDMLPFQTAGGSGEGMVSSTKPVMHEQAEAAVTEVPAPVTEVPAPVKRPLLPKTATYNGGEVSSANYPARRFGISAGMTVRQACELCPELVVLPYDFANIQRISEAIFGFFLEVTKNVQAVSCDEAYLDLTGISNPIDVVQKLREDIARETGCTVSAGIGPNMLLARLATAKAKPNGLYVCPNEPSVISKFLEALHVTALPGVGWSTGQKLESRGIRTVQELKTCALADLEALLGNKTAHSLLNYARGVDRRKLKYEKERKSIGAEVNWGIRFSNMEQAHEFIRKLAAEVSLRMHRETSPSPPLLAKCITFKLMIRKPDAGEPFKHMGHGACYSYSRSANLTVPTAESKVIQLHALQLFDSFAADPTQVRGVGIQMTKLSASPSESAPSAARGILSYLQAGSSKRARPLSGDSEDSGTQRKRSRPTVDCDEDSVAEESTERESESQEPDSVHVEREVETASESDEVVIVSPSAETKAKPQVHSAPHCKQTSLARFYGPHGASYRDESPVIEIDMTQAKPPTPVQEGRDHDDLFAPSHEANLAGVKPAFKLEALSTSLEAVTGWIKSVGAAPLPRHAKLLAAYGIHLVSEGSLDEAATWLRCLKRIAIIINDESSRPDLMHENLEAWRQFVPGCATWLDVVSHVEAEVQQACQTTCGRTLAWDT